MGLIDLEDMITANRNQLFIVLFYTNHVSSCLCDLIYVSYKKQNETESSLNEITQDIWIATVTSGFIEHARNFR